MTCALRSVLLTATFVLCAFAAQAEDVLRVTGAVNYRNYPGFASLLFDRLEKPVALDITIPHDNEEAEEHLTTFMQDGRLEVTLHGGPNGSKILTDTGFQFVDENYYTLQGVFAVQPGGVLSGIPHLLLQPAALPKGATFAEVAAETLEPADAN